MARTVIRAVIMAGTLLLSACGFQLQGDHDYAFKRLYIAGASPAFTAYMRRMIEGGSDTRVVEKPADADATLSLTFNRSQNVLSLNAQGVATEYEVDESVSYTLYSSRGQVLIPTSTLRANRSLTYADQFVLAKQQEADLLNRDMDNDIAQQMMRRLALVTTMTPTPQQQVPAINPRVPLPPPEF